MSEDPKKKFKIENLDIATRKKILISLVSIIMISVIFIWVSSFSQIFNIKTNDTEAQKLVDIKNSLKDIFKTSQEEISDIKDKFDQIGEIMENQTLTTTTATTSINNQDLEKLKNKILEQDSNTQ